MSATSFPPSAPIPPPSAGGRGRAWMVAAALAAVCLAGYVYTGRRGASGNAAASEGIPAVIYRPLARDEALYQTATGLAALADTADEQSNAQRAEQLADEVLDLSFTNAMAEAAALPQAPPGPDAAADQLRVRQDTAAVAADQQALAAAQRAAATAAKSASAPEPDPGAVSLAQAQLDLDQDRLTDARNDSARSSAGGASRLQQLQQEHEALHTPQHSAASAALGQGAGAAARNPAQVRGLVGQLHAAWLLQQTVAQLRAAEAAARARVPAILARHDAMHTQFAAKNAALTAPGASTGAARVGSLRTLAGIQEEISRFDQQAEAAGELADTYQGWLPLAQAQRRAALHDALRALLQLLLLILALTLALAAVRRVLFNPRWERKQALMLTRVLSLAAEVLALALALLLIFGEPTQLATVLGLVGAGLAVAFQDAILSLVGWFVLMGRNGVRVGDWVEINGVVGEVVDVRLLKTIVLETGNWITPGHPTGRRVFFPNNFALKGSYFNFSTLGQWLWDELAVQVPAAMDAQHALAAVTAAVERELAPEAARAQAEWHHARMEAPFTTAPTVRLRPAGGQITLVVRYTTPAQERLRIRERLYDVVATALDVAPSAPPAPASTQIAGQKV